MLQPQQFLSSHSSSPPFSIQTLNPTAHLTQSPPQSFNSSNFSQTLTLSSNNYSDQKRLTVKCQYFDQQKFTSSIPSPTDSASPAVGGSRPRFFVGHSIYKGKAALTVEPRAPEFVSLDSGAFKISRDGYVLLQFAPAAGVRLYDWSKKQVFSLSVTEIGTLLDLGARGSCEFFHDPFKGKSDEGKVRKVLKVEPLPDGSGHFFNLSVQNKSLNMDESIYIPITRAEYAVLTSAFDFILPYLIGWHAFADSIKPEDSNRANHADSRYGGDYEWNK
ncbi:Whirly domain-containing protein [Cephalotus follicularis]|uniref:Whirly domain-containing protein n=1 Tax=Cephalotus follicularis TaxID=3775 RepID=A0A1Q3D545_CEPFO|nr:Whirly domain-containing protein [Cephalotus follicularis]